MSVLTPIINLIFEQTGISISKRTDSDYLCIAVGDKSVLLDKAQSERLVGEVNSIVQSIDKSDE